MKFTSFQLDNITPSRVLCENKITRRIMVMNHPLWLINSSLFLTLLLAIAFIFFSKPTIPVRARLIPTEIKAPKKPALKVDSTKIYTNDLFGTYQEPMVPPKEPEVSAIPQPPAPQPVKVPLATPPKFLDPLQVSLKGMIIVSNEAENIAIIEDSKTKTTKNYKVGDKVEDAQLIRIMRNKITFIRSNGQQETIYVSQHDAELDQLIALRTEWDMIVKKINENAYSIDPQTFVEQVQNLAQFIDMFNITTVYQKGQSIGCRIGSIGPKSLPKAMGLETGDIITHINDIPADTTENRYAIYEKIIALTSNTIIVTIKRSQATITMTYELKELAATSTKKDDVTEKFTSKPSSLQKEQLLKEHEKLAPTIYDLQKQEKRDLLFHGKRKNHNTISNT